MVFYQKEKIEFFLISKLVRIPVLGAWLNSCIPFFFFLSHLPSTSELYHIKTNEMISGKMRQIETNKITHR